MAKRKKDQATDVNYDAIAARKTKDDKEEVIAEQLKANPVPCLTDAITHRSRGGQMILEKMDKEAAAGHYDTEKRKFDPRREWKIRVLKIRTKNSLRDPKPGDKIEFVISKTNRLPSGKKIGTSKIDEYKRMGKDSFSQHDTLIVGDDLCISCEYPIASHILCGPHARHYRSGLPMHGYPQDILYEELVEFEEDEKVVKNETRK